MSLPQKLPRRHAQRKTLYYGRHKPPLLDLPGAQNPQALKLPAKKKTRFPISGASDCSATSGSDSDFKSDSGYTSNSSLDSEAEHYRKIRAEFVDAGPNLANPCDTTKESIKREEQNWNLHCKRIKKGDPVAALKTATAEDFKTYLVWRRKNSRIKKQGSMSICWHIVSMHY